MVRLSMDNSLIKYDTSDQFTSKTINYMQVLQKGGVLTPRSVAKGARRSRPLEKNSPLKEIRTYHCPKHFSISPTLKYVSPRELYLAPIQ